MLEGDACSLEIEVTERSEHVSKEVGDHADGVESTLLVHIVVLPVGLEAGANVVVVGVVLSVEPLGTGLTALLVVSANDLASDLSGSVLGDPELAVGLTSRLVVLIELLALNGVVGEHVLSELVNGRNAIHGSVTDEVLRKDSVVGVHEVAVLVDGTGELVVAGAEGPAVLLLENILKLEQVVVLDLLDAVLVTDLAHDGVHEQELLVGDEVKSGGVLSRGVKCSDSHYFIII